MHRTVGLVIFCAKSKSRTKYAKPDTFAKKRSAAGDQGVRISKSTIQRRFGAISIESILFQVMNFFKVSNFLIFA